MTAAVIERQDIVVVEQCFGCNRLRIPKPWGSKAMLDLLRSEGRLRFTEYLCGHADCGMWGILGVNPPPAVVRGPAKETTE